MDKVIILDDQTEWGMEAGWSVEPGVIKKNKQTKKKTILRVSLYHGDIVSLAEDYL